MTHLYRHRNYHERPRSIGILAPVQEAIPPLQYGGSERVVESLVKGLAQLGVDVHLFAAGNASQEIKDICTLHPIVPHSLRQTPPFDTNVIQRELMTATVSVRAFEMAQKLNLDIMNNHMGFQALPASLGFPMPIVTTLHGDLAFPVESQMFELDSLSNHPVISISNSQRKGKPKLNYVATVHNPIAVDTFDLRTGDEPGLAWKGTIDLKAGTYLAWLGRFSREKRPHLAIDTAMLLGMPIVLAGKREPHEEDYWQDAIAPRLAKYGDRIVLLPEVNNAEKNLLMRGALAFLMPINWQEPFGLVVPEAMACGTPVVATRMGAMPEIIVEGKTGYLVDSIDDEAALTKQFAARVRLCGNLSRKHCRTHVEEKFSSTNVAEGYLRAYECVLSHRASKRKIARTA